MSNKIHQYFQDSIRCFIILSLLFHFFPLFTLTSLVEVCRLSTLVAEVYRGSRLDRHPTPFAIFRSSYLYLIRTKFQTLLIAVHNWHFIDCGGAGLLRVHTSSVPVASAYSQPRIHQILLHGHVVGKVWELFRQFVSFIFVFILFALFFIPRSYCYFFLGFSALRVLFSAARCLPVGFSSNESLAFCVSVHFFLSLTWSSHQRNFVFALCLLRVCGSRISYTCFLLVTGLAAQWTLEARWLMFTLLMT